MALQLQKNNKQSLCVSFYYNLKGIEVKSYPAPAYRINTKLFRQHKVRNLGRWTDNREKAKQSQGEESDTGENNQVNKCL